MRAYKFNSETGELCGPYLCQKNPIEGGYLIPPDCTTIEPGPDKEGFVQIWRGASWEYVVDLRGTSVWDTTTKQEYRILKFMENIPEGYTDKKPSPLPYIVWNKTKQDWIEDSVKKILYENELHDNRIKAEIQELDLKRIRSLSCLTEAILDGTTPNDVDKQVLKKLNQAIEEKRNSLIVKG